MEHVWLVRSFMFKKLFANTADCQMNVKFNASRHSYHKNQSFERFTKFSASFFRLLRNILKIDSFIISFVKLTLSNVICDLSSVSAVPILQTFLLNTAFIGQLHIKTFSLDSTSLKMSILFGCQKRITATILQKTEKEYE